MNLVCPICEKKIDLDEKPEDEELIVCTECGAELIAHVKGNKIKLEEYNEEDYEDEDSDY